MHRQTLDTLDEVAQGTSLTKTDEICPSHMCSSRLWQSHLDGNGRSFHVCLRCGAIDVRSTAA